MASSTLTHLADRAPVGSRFTVHPAAGRQEGQAPCGPTLAKGVLKPDGSVTFRRLDPGTRYVAHTMSGDQHLYVTFATRKAA